MVAWCISLPSPTKKNKKKTCAPWLRFSPAEHEALTRWFDGASTLHKGLGMITFEFPDVVAIIPVVCGLWVYCCILGHLRLDLMPKQWLPVLAPAVFSSVQLQIFLNITTSHVLPLTVLGINEACHFIWFPANQSQHLIDRWHIQWLKNWFTKVNLTCEPNCGSNNKGKPCNFLQQR